MKKSKMIAIVLAAVLVFVGIYLLYDNLSKRYGAGGLVIDKSSVSSSLVSGSQAESLPTGSLPESSLPTSSIAESVQSAASEADKSSAAGSKAESPSVSSAASAVFEESRTSEPEVVENPAPDFTVIDYNGDKVKLSDLRGKPVVLNFWASWCHYCTVEMPDFEAMYKKYGTQVQFMMVDLTDGRAETVTLAKKHISDNEFTFPVYFDTESKAAIAYGVSGIPVTYFIDAAGSLVAHGNGMMDAQTLEKGIAMILQ